MEGLPSMIIFSSVEFSSFGPVLSFRDRRSSRPDPRNPSRILGPVYLLKRKYYIFPIYHPFCWAGRSVGRSLPWHGRGREFESRPVHLLTPIQMFGFRAVSHDSNPLFVQFSNPSSSLRKGSCRPMTRGPWRSRCRASCGCRTPRSSWCSSGP